MGGRGGIIEARSSSRLRTRASSSLFLAWLCSCSAGVDALATRCSWDWPPEACAEAGGEFRGFLQGNMGCFCPASDSGRVCTASDQCEGSCIVDYDLCQTASEGLCSPFYPGLGCGCFIDLRFIDPNRLGSCGCGGDLRRNVGRRLTRPCSCRPGLRPTNGVPTPAPRVGTSCSPADRGTNIRGRS